MGEVFLLGRVRLSLEVMKKRILASEGQMASKELYVLVRTNTTRVKIDDQWDILAVTAGSMVE